MDGLDSSSSLSARDRFQGTELDHSRAWLESLAGWTLLESNVIGEFQWRVIFREYGMGALAGLAAAGWDGDRYAVLSRDGDELLFLSTVWDSEAEAEEFAADYSSLLDVKYRDVNESTRVERRGDTVLIVEGGDPERMSDYLDILRRAERGD